MEIGFILLCIGGCCFVYCVLIPNTIEYLIKKYREKNKPKEEEPKIVFLFKV